MTGAAALLCTGTPGLADELDAEKAPAAESVSAGVVSLLATVTPLSEEQLGEQRAAARLEIEDVTINSSNQEGVVGGNAAINNRTGQNLITGDAFSGASGLIHSVQNTGNNVLIQNSTIVNVSIEP